MLTARQAVEWLSEKLADRAVTVSYSRGETSITVSASIGASRYEQTDEAGFVTESAATDFIVAAVELLIGPGGAAGEPRLGDRISVAEAGVTRLYEVLELPGQGCWRRADPHGVLLRVHARQIEPDA
jgi:hypothetical protein